MVSLQSSKHSFLNCTLWWRCSAARLASTEPSVGTFFNQKRTDLFAILSRTVCLLSNTLLWRREFFQRSECRHFLLTRCWQ